MAILSDAAMVETSVFPDRVSLSGPAAGAPTGYCFARAPIKGAERLQAIDEARQALDLRSGQIGEVERVTVEIDPDQHGDDLKTLAVIGQRDREPYRRFRRRPERPDLHAGGAELDARRLPVDAAVLADLDGERNPYARRA